MVRMFIIHNTTLLFFRISPPFPPKIISRLNPQSTTPPMSDADSTFTTTADPQSLIFFYGTLKKGFPNHHLIEQFTPSNDAVFMGVYLTVNPFPLICGPLGVPFLINKPGSGHRVRGELYAVSGLALSRLDELEGIELGHYERFPLVLVAAEGGDGVLVEAEAYFAHRSFGEEMWRKSGEVGREDYLVKDGEEYVRIEDREAGLNLRECIDSYLKT